MTYPSFLAHWSAIHDQQNFVRLEQQARHEFSQANDWNVNPEGMTTVAWRDYLRLRLWGVDKASEFARFCLEVAQRNAHEARQRNTFADVKPEGSFPLNRYAFLESKLFIDALVSGESLNRDTVIQIVEDQKALAPGYGKRQWDGHPQSQYLHAVDLLLLVDEYDRALAMLKEARSLTALHVKQVAEITKLVAQASGIVGDNDQAREQYRRMFDLLRDPKYPDSLRGHPAFKPQLLVMACVWEKYFDPGEGIYSLDRAIDLLRA